MQSLTAVLTTACNLGCAYCFQTRRDAPTIAWPMLRKAVDLLLEHGAENPRIGLTGGEPLLALSLIHRLVAHLDDQDLGAVRPTVATNGLLIDPPTARFLAASRIEVRMSFDGLAQDNRAPGTLDQLEKTVLRLRHTEPVLFHERLAVVFTLTSANLELLADSVAYLLGLGLPSIEVFPISTHDPGWRDDTTDELERQWSQVVDHSLRHLQRTGAVPLKMLQDSPQPPAPEAALCSAGRGSHLLVDVDGRVYPCTMLARSYQCLPEPWRQRIWGSAAPHIMDEDIVERLAAASELMRRTGLFHHRDRKHSHLGRCADCPAIDSCMTCPVAAVHIPGNTNPQLVPINQCAFNRVVHAHRNRFPARPSAVDMLTGDTPLPTAMSDLLR